MTKINDNKSDEENSFSFCYFFGRPILINCKGHPPEIIAMTKRGDVYEYSPHDKQPRALGTNIKKYK